jgi:multidrug efflux pump subunit AcrA (membrane-fusion protein)
MNTLFSNRFRFNKKFALLILGLCILIFVAYMLFNSFLTPKKAPPEPIQTVTTTLVEQKDYHVIIETSGNIVATSIVDIRPQVSSLVAKIHIKDGQSVKAGDLLFTLDDRADKANYEKFKALAEDAERQYKRALELAKQNFISQASVDTAMANANSARAAANSAQVTLSYDYIRSPISGRAGVINVFPGSLVSPSNVVSTTSSTTATTAQGSMVTISQLNPINVQFTVPEAEMASLIKLQNTSEGLLVNVNIGDGLTKQGKVYVVDNQVDPAIGAVRVKAVLDNSDLTLAPGRFVHINLQTQLIKDALVVPSQAIISNTLGNLIYTVNSDDKTVMNKVKIITQGNGSAVITGLKPNDRIVVEGKQNIRPDMKVVEAKTNNTSQPAEQKN